MSQSAAQRIVVVDDDDATLKLLSKQLQLAGYHVDAFADAQSALPAVTAMGTGIVIADWEMPVMNGLELCRAVRELEEMRAVQHIYFIVLTAHTSKTRVIEGLEAGANDYLTKPYHAGELLARIQVGQRMLRLQAELMQRQIEVQKTNAQMALLARKLDEQARTDSMTRLPNRRSIIERMNEAWESHIREQNPLACIMLDVDHFKSVNDTYGHEIGDDVLKHVANILRKCVRRPELCGRFGGEEFLCVCRGMDLDAATQLAERIRQSIAAVPVDASEHTIRVTISSGVATPTPDMQSPEDLIRVADELLYAAKENGRNQVWAQNGRNRYRVPPFQSASDAETPTPV